MPQILSPLDPVHWGRGSGGVTDTHNLIKVDSGFSNGFLGSTDGQRYTIVHEHLMELCYRGRAWVVDDRVVGVAYGRAGVDTGELVDGAYFFHRRALWMVPLR